MVIALLAQVNLQDTAPRQAACGRDALSIPRGKRHAVGPGHLPPVATSLTCSATRGAGNGRRAPDEWIFVVISLIVAASLGISVCLLVLSIASWDVRLRCL